MNQKVDALVERYIKLRDLKDKIKELAKEKLAPVENKMKEIEDELQEFLNNTGQTSAKTANGTFFKKISSSVTVEDMDKVISFIKTNNAFDLLDSRVNKTAALKYLNEGYELDGVKVTSVYVVQIRKS